MIVAPKEIAHQVLDSLRGTPFVLALIVINCTAWLLFAYTLHEIAQGNERADKMIASCIERASK